jgi:nucleotide-binding universal stress UspA family protein
MHIAAAEVDFPLKTPIRTGRTPADESSPPVLAYIDDPALSRTVVPHAVAMASALNAPLTLLHVLDVPQSAEIPADPVARSIRRRKAGEMLSGIAGSQKSADIRVDVAVFEGQLVEQICLWARENKAGLTIVGTRDDGPATNWGREEIAHKLVERVSGNLMLIPSSPSGQPIAAYRRVLVPLDGSCRAESVLPLAMRIATANDAELVLAHVIPVTELTETGPLEAEDHLLLETVTRRNERVARKYIERIRLRVVQSGLDARSIVTKDGDVRSLLAKLIVEQHIDLLVMTSHGHSGSMDCACGNVASYMLNHTATPLLLALRPPLPKHAKILQTDRPNQRYPDRSARGR